MHNCTHVCTKTHACIIAKVHKCERVCANTCSHLCTFVLTCVQECMPTCAHSRGQMCVWVWVGVGGCVGCVTGMYVRGFIEGLSASAMLCFSLLRWATHLPTPSRTHPPPLTHPPTDSRSRTRTQIQHQTQTYTHTQTHTQTYVPCASGHFLLQHSSWLVFP